MTTARQSLPTAWRLPSRPRSRQLVAVGRHRIVLVLLWTMALLLAVEVALQIRLQLRTGQSAASFLSGQSAFVVDKTYSLQLLRPGAVIAGDQQTIRSNRLGLRSPELAPVKAAGEYRIAVIGASSVMGAYAKTNEQTLPAIIERHLRRTQPSLRLHVINAGIVGYGLSEQKRMLEYVADKLAPDLVLVYSGTNDFTTYCRAPNAAAAESEHSLPQFQLPKWLASRDLLLKNTVMLRPTPLAARRLRDASAVDTTEYRLNLEALVRTAQQRKIKLILATNARSFRPDQPLSVQERLSETARFYNDCFDVAGLNVLYARHNEAIRQVGAALDVPVLPVGERVPGGSEFFHDASHLNDRANEIVADMFVEFLSTRRLLERRGGGE